MSDVSPGITSFVAIGDSFTEGMNDESPDGGFRGWADRLAEMIAARDPGFRYANLAVRGKLLGQIVKDQVPAAVSLLADAPRPALVSIAGGGNNLLRPGGDPDSLAELFDAAVARLRQTGSRVLMFTGFDPKSAPLISLIRGRVAAYNLHLRAIADARGCDLVDLWSMRSLAEPSAWSPDRLHLSPESHRAVAERAAEVLGIMPAAATVAPPPPLVWSSVEHMRPTGRAAWLAARREDAQWAREYFVPWVQRRIKGTSTGDGRSPKRPQLRPVRAPSGTVPGQLRAASVTGWVPASRGGRFPGRPGCCGPRAWPRRTWAGQLPAAACRGRERGEQRG
jgi:lysophospholipase L1-like esterase